MYRELTESEKDRANRFLLDYAMNDGYVPDLADYDHFKKQLRLLLGNIVKNGKKAYSEKY